jgi:hypothetical protein
MGREPVVEAGFMQRIRAGVTGLGLVFLITLIGSIAIARDPRPEALAEPGEPLSELGVAPAPQRDPPGGERPASGRNGFPETGTGGTRI